MDRDNTCEIGCQEVSRDGQHGYVNTSISSEYLCITDFLTCLAVYRGALMTGQLQVASSMRNSDLP